MQKSNLFNPRRPPYPYKRAFPLRVPVAACLSNQSAVRLKPEWVNARNKPGEVAEGYTVPRPRKARPPRDETAPTSFTPDIDIWSLAIRDLDTEATAEAKATFLDLYRRGASPKEAAYSDGKGVSYRQILIWQHEDAEFRDQMAGIADERRAHPALAQAIFLDHLASTHNKYGAAEAGGLTLSEFKAMAKVDRSFKKAWKLALAYAVGSVEQAAFLAAVRNDRDTLGRMFILNSHRRETYKPESIPGDRIGAGDVTFNFYIDTKPDNRPKRLPAQSGEIIDLPAGGDDADD